jgi:PAS domain S-box-containing protein
MAESGLFFVGACTAWALALGWSSFLAYRLKEGSLLIFPAAFLLLGVILILPYRDPELLEYLWRSGLIDLTAVAAGLVAALVVGRSMAHHRSAKQELKDAYDKLEAQGHERAAALAEQNRKLEEEIAERRRAEEALRAERDYSAAIVESSPVIICGMDPQGRATYINPAGEHLTGYRAHEIVGRNWGELLFPGDELRQHERWMQESAKEGAYDHELVLTTRRGQKRTLSWSSICRRSEAGEIVEIIGFGNDITRRKQLEEQLRYSQKMEAVGRLAGGVAHDFNNLLTVISGYSDIILEDLDSDNAIYSDVTEILKASDRAASLTRQLLAFSRRQVLRLRLISLVSVVSDAEKMLRSLIGEDINLITEFEPGLGSVRADAGQMEQVILNLAVNAHDAMPNGGCIRIATKNVDIDESFVSRHPYAQAGPHVMLTVSDTGIGMDEETRLRVFEPFFTTKELGKGTGLGLSTVYGIVRQSGGCIWVESSHMAGTSIHICLPRVDQPPDEEPLQLAGAREHSGSETVLLVEDEPAVRTMVRRILEDEGYTVIEAAEGREAFEIASRREHAIGLLLTDVVMPRMGGRELAQRLASVHPAMKVIYMTGYTDQAISDAPFLHKPFTSRSLLTKLREVLDSSPAASRNGGSRSQMRREK